MRLYVFENLKVKKEIKKNIYFTETYSIVKFISNIWPQFTHVSRHEKVKIKKEKQL